MAKERSLLFSITASAIGSSIRVVAVLEIHMLNKNAVSINPRMILPGLSVPMALRTLWARY